MNRACLAFQFNINDYAPIYNLLRIFMIKKLSFYFNIKYILVKRIKLFQNYPIPKLLHGD